MRLNLIAMIAVLSLGGGGCSSGSSGSGGPGGVGGTSAGGTSAQGGTGQGGATGGGSYASRRSPTCKAALSSICDHMADRCMELTRAECDNQFGALFCVDDRLAACTGALPNADCGGLPDECSGVGDSAPAVQFCGEFLDKLCSQAVACDPSMGTKQDCLSQAGQQIDCSSAIGVRASGDQCLSDLPNHPCMSTGLPTSCEAVLLTSGATMHLPTVPVGAFARRLRIRDAYAPLQLQR